MERIFIVESFKCPSSRCRRDQARALATVEILELTRTTSGALCSRSPECGLECGTSEELGKYGREHGQASVDNTEKGFEGSKNVELDLAILLIQYINLANKLQANCGNATDAVTEVSKVPIVPLT
jgi:hypothetical protein